MKTPPWDDGRMMPGALAEYGRLGREARRHCDTLASYSVAAAKAYLLGRIEMRAELAEARATARAALLEAVEAGERREREGGSACP